MKKNRNALSILLTRTKVQRSKSSLNKVTFSKVAQSEGYLKIYQRIQIVRQQLSQDQSQKNKVEIDFDIINQEQAPIQKNLMVLKFLAKFNQMKETLIKVRDQEQPLRGSLKEIKQSRLTQFKSFDSIMSADTSENESVLSSQSSNFNQNIRRLSQQVLQVKRKKNQNCRPVLSKLIQFDKNSSKILRNRRRNKTTIEMNYAKRNSSPSINYNPNFMETQINQRYQQEESSEQDNQNKQSGNFAY